MNTYLTYLRENLRITMVRALFTIALAASVLLLPVSAHSQSFLNDAETIAAHKIADIVASQNNATGSLLSEIGYSPPYHRDTWEAFPAIRQLEAAYFSAENMKAGNGNQMLAMLTKKLSLEYESVRYDDALSPFYHQQSPADDLISFNQRIIEPTDINLSDDVRKGIARISFYTDSGALGGPQTILRYYFDLDPDTVYEILRSSASNKTALEIGLSHSRTPPTHVKRLAELVSDLQVEYESARQIDEFDQILRDANPNNDIDTRLDNTSRYPLNSNPSEDIYRPTVDQNRGNTPKYLDVADTASQNALDSVGSSGGGGGGFAPFDLLLDLPGGFGGVMFGNSVDEATIPKVNSVLWIPDRMNSHDTYMSAGILEFTLEDGTKRIVVPVNQEDVSAAFAIVYSGIEDMIPPMLPNSGIGLVSLEDFQPTYEITDLGLEANGRRAQVVLHPAVADLDIGWSLAYVDGFPLAESELIAKVKEHIENPEQIQAVVSWLELAKSVEMFTWKIIDQPMTIASDGYQIHVHRTNNPTNESVGSEQSEDSVLSIVGYSDVSSKDGLLEWEEEFELIMPTLISSIHEYDRVNEFAKVFALLRWAKNDGAQFLNIPVKPDGPATPGAFGFTTDGEIVVESSADERTRYNEMSNDLLELLVSAGTDLPDALMDVQNTYIDLVEEARDVHNFEWQALDDVKVQSLSVERTDALSYAADVRYQIIADMDVSQFTELNTWLSYELRELSESDWEEYQKNLAEMIRLEEIYWEAESGSVLESSASSRWGDLNTSNQDILSESFPAYTVYRQIEFEIDGLANAFLSAEPDSSQSTSLESRLYDLLLYKTDFVFEEFPQFYQSQLAVNIWLDLIQDLEFVLSNELEKLVGMGNSE